jgi:hypothetical protein
MKNMQLLTLFCPGGHAGSDATSAAAEPGRPPVPAAEQHGGGRHQERPDHERVQQDAEREAQPDPPELAAHDPAADHGAQRRHVLGRSVDLDRELHCPAIRGDRAVPGRAQLPGVLHRHDAADLAAETGKRQHRAAMTTSHETTTTRRNLTTNLARPSKNMLPPWNQRQPRPMVAITLAGVVGLGNRFFLHSRR